MREKQWPPADIDPTGISTEDRKAICTRLEGFARGLARDIDFNAERYPGLTDSSWLSPRKEMSVGVAKHWIKVLKQAQALLESAP